MAARLVTLPLSCRIICKPRGTLVSRAQTFTSSSVNQARSQTQRRTQNIGVKPTSLWERLNQPVADNAFGVSRGVVAAGAALGMGALCYYTSGVGGIGIREESLMWPQYVKDRVKSTYMYFGGSLAITAASAVAAFRSPTLLRIASSSSMLSIFGSIALMIGSGMVCRSIPYQEGFGAKHVAWVVHSGVVGGVLAPMCFLGGPLLLRAAWYTAGLVGGLSAIAVCAPSDKFLKWQAPLGMGLGVVFMSSLAGAFLPPTTVLGAGLYSISMYGGLALFSAFLLYDTQKIMANAQHYPAISERPFDPINSSISIYLDAVNIFIRIAILLSGGNRKK